MQQVIQKKGLLSPAHLVTWIHHNHQIIEHALSPGLLLKLLCKDRKFNFAGKQEEGTKYSRP